MLRPLCTAEDDNAKPSSGSPLEAMDGHVIGAGRCVSGEEDENGGGGWQRFRGVRPVTDGSRERPFRASIGEGATKRCVVSCSEG